MTSQADQKTTPGRAGRGFPGPENGLRRSARRLFLALPAFLLGTLPGHAHGGARYAFDDAGYLGEATLMPDWSATMARERQQAPLLDACVADAERCPGYYRGLRHLLRKARDLPPHKQILLVNYYVNKRRYRRDRSWSLATPLSGEPVKYRSRWATVEEFMRRGGDCEDYATTKYYLLRRLGFDADRLRIVVTWDRGAGGYHAVLAVRQENRIRLLDSDNTIRRGSRHRYRFIYSLNEKSIWDHEAPGASASRGSHQQKEEPPA